MSAAVDDVEAKRAAKRAYLKAYYQRNRITFLAKAKVRYAASKRDAGKLEHGLERAGKRECTSCRRQRRPAAFVSMHADVCIECAMTPRQIEQQRVALNSRMHAAALGLAELLGASTRSARA